MTRLVSLGTQIEQLDGLRDTNDLNQWEQAFVTSILDRYLLAGRDTRVLSGKQALVIDRIWRQHFS